MELFGLEALSRGAEKAVLCDISCKSMNIIRKNVEKTKLLDKTILINNNYEKAIQEIKSKDIKFDVIFLDPPYESDFAEDASKKIIDYDLLKEDGIIIIETDNMEKVISNMKSELLYMYNQKKYGRVYLLFFKLGRNG